MFNLNSVFSVKKNVHLSISKRKVHSKRPSAHTTMGCGPFSKRQILFDALLTLSYFNPTPLYK
jgi:hypothetical protein